MDYILGRDPRECGFRHANKQSQRKFRWQFGRFRSSWAVIEFYCVSIDMPKFSPEQVGDGKKEGRACLCASPAQLDREGQVRGSWAGRFGRMRIRAPAWAGIHRAPEGR